MVCSTDFLDPDGLVVIQFECDGQARGSTRLVYSIDTPISDNLVSTSTTTGLPYRRLLIPRTWLGLAGTSLRVRHGRQWIGLLIRELVEY